MSSSNDDDGDDRVPMPTVGKKHVLRERANSISQKDARFLRELAKGTAEEKAYRLAGLKAANFQQHIKKIMNKPGAAAYLAQAKADAALQTAETHDPVKIKEICARELLLIATGDAFVLADRGCGGKEKMEAIKLLGQMFNFSFVKGRSGEVNNNIQVNVDIPSNGRELPIVSFGDEGDDDQ